MPRSMMAEMTSYDSGFWYYENGLIVGSQIQSITSRPEQPQCHFEVVWEGCLSFKNKLEFWAFACWKLLGGCLLGLGHLWSASTVGPTTTLPKISWFTELDQLGASWFYLVLWSTQRLSTFMSTQRISRYVDIIFTISTKEQWKNKMSIITHEAASLGTKRHINKLRALMNGY